MALIIDLPTPSGVPASYHNITRMEADFRSSQSWVMVASYASAETRDQGCTPLKEETYIIPLPLPLEIFQSLPPVPLTDTRVLGYAMLRSLPQFADATNG